MFSILGTYSKSMSESIDNIKSATFYHRCILMIYYTFCFKTVIDSIFNPVGFYETKINYLQMKDFFQNGCFTSCRLIDIDADFQKMFIKFFCILLHTAYCMLFKGGHCYMINSHHQKGTGPLGTGKFPGTPFASSFFSKNLKTFERQIIFAQN